MPGFRGQQALDRYYNQQSGGGTEIQYFSGPGYQRGHGLGGLFGKLFRAAVPVFRHTVAPMLKKAGAEVAKEALTSGVGVATDMLEGESFGNAARSRLNTAANRMANRGVRALEQMVASPTPRRRRRPATKRPTGAAVKRVRKTIKGGDLFG